MNDNCLNLWLGYYICVHVPGATTTSAAPEPMSNPSEPTPQMPGAAENCDEFYQVESGDQCDSIASAQIISIDQLRSWNSEIIAGLYPS
ncbi:uncharacterized protein BDV14DRAFT_205413 [Aspergillus stella-maris]|uniref:uncharacterized protein n=1 Tax=Aspergillus stella-maris TaxID=1810926 RepID=UPI003CCD2748